MATIASYPKIGDTALRDRLILALGVVVGGLILLAFTHAAAAGRPLLAGRHDAWLVLHLASVIPAIPLGAYVLWRRKGDRLHRMLGRVWALLMLTAALSSFGLKGLTGGFSWIHILSIVIVVMIPRGIIQVMRQDIASHRRTMTLTYLGLVGAGLFTFMPGRLLGFWLFG
jgi:uncharacterized membrane protein